MNRMKSLLTGACALFASAFLASAQEGFQPLFNGEDLTGWDGNPKFWSVDNGEIVGKTTADIPTRGNTFLIFREHSVDDFELVLEYKLIGGNSGIQYRSVDLGNWVVSGYQGDFEAGTTYSGILYHEKGRGILAQRGQVTKVVDGDEPGRHRVEVIGSVGDTEDIQSVIKSEDWNEYRIVANGNQFTHIINGRVTAMVIDEHAAGSRKSGVLALQVHAGPPMELRVRNIRLRPIR